MQSAVNLGWFALIVGGHKAQGGAGSEHHSIKINHQDYVHPATISVMIIANMITGQHLWSRGGRWSREAGCKRVLQN